MRRTGRLESAARPSYGIAMPLPPWAQRIVTWSGHAEPRLAAAGRIAVLIALAEPLYGALVWLVAGADAWAVLPVFASLPLLAAVPPLCRRRAEVGRWLALAAPLFAASLAVLGLGSASRAGLFFLPALALVPLVFAQGQRLRALAIALAGALAVLAAAMILGRGLTAFTPQEIYGLAKLHAAGAIGLLAVVAIESRRLWPAERQPAAVEKAAVPEAKPRPNAKKPRRAKKASGAGGAD